MERFLLISNIAATLFMTGVIWIVQLVQYPFFAHFDSAGFTKYHDDYRFWITPVVAPAMIAELLTSLLLIFFAPSDLDPKLLWAGLILTLLVWASTFFIQVPLHEKLARGFDLNTIDVLTNTNWVRTAAWSLRSLLVLYFAWLVMRP